MGSQKVKISSFPISYTFLHARQYPRGLFAPHPRGLFAPHPGVVVHDSLCWQLPTGRIHFDELQQRLLNSRGLRGG